MVRAQKESHLVCLGRIFLAASFLFLMGAVFMRVTDGMGLHMNAQFLFNDAIVSAVFGGGLYFFGKRRQ